MKEVSILYRDSTLYINIAHKLDMLSPNKWLTVPWTSRYERLVQ